MLIDQVTKLNDSDTVLITAVTGGIGRIFSQWAKSKGAIVIGTVGSNEKISIATGSKLLMNIIKYKYRLP